MPEWCPPLEALRINLVDQLKAGSRSSIGSGRTQRLRNIFAVAQIALAVALVIGAALMAKGMNAWLHAADFYQPDKMLTFNVHLPATRYDTAAEAGTVVRRQLARLRSLPGVNQAELTPALALRRQRLAARCGDREPAHRSGQVPERA